MSKEIEKLMQDQAEALSEARSAVKEIKALGLENKAGASEAKEKADRANAVLDKIETKNQEIVADINAARKEQKELKMLAEEQAKEIKSLGGKIADLGMLGNRSDDPEVDRRIRLEKENKSLTAFAHNATMRTPEELKRVGVELKYFRSDNDPQGGFLMDESYDDKIRRQITEISPIRQIAMTKTIPGLGENLYVESQDFTAYWTAEGQTPFTESNQTYSQPKIPLHSITVKTSTTNKAAMGSKFSFDNIVAAGFRRVTLKAEGSAFVNGNGIDKPTGFMSTKANIESNQSTTSAGFISDDLITLTGDIKEGYRGIFGFNRKTLAYIRNLTFKNGDQVWQPGNLGAGIPNEINGEAYVLIPDMADIAASTYPVVYGDFLEGYEIVDSTQAIFLRNPYIKDGYVVYTLESFTGADVVMKEALIKLQCGA